MKHEFAKNFRKANLENAKNALAGAFLLNVVHKPAIMRIFLFGVAKPKHRSFYVQYGDIGIMEKPSSEALNDILKDTIYPPLYVETELFFFDYEKREEEEELP